MKSELGIGAITVIVSFLLLVRTEYRNYSKNQRDNRIVLIGKAEAMDQIENKLGDQVVISFVRELESKYYFEVSDPVKDSTYDVYVDKKRPKVQTYRKGGYSTDK